MRMMSRRFFVGRAAAGLAAVSATGLAARETDRIVMPGEWPMGEFDRLLKTPYAMKQLYDVPQVEDGNALQHMGNSLNGLQFGFGIAPDGIKVVGGLRGAATVMNLADGMWEKYRIGAMRMVNDPQTGKPAERNPFAASTVKADARGGLPGLTAGSPAAMDWSMEGLRARGVQFMACHMALFALAEDLVKERKLTAKPEEVLLELKGHLLPGVLEVPSMVSAIAVLQSRGQFTYIRM